ncbi:MAG: peptidoglycan DD-metalloendopeptidase family protein [bacterium]|nr:peptidoglycan DD-metalloendopeptidase family protein [bacterium]
MKILCKNIFCLFLIIILAGCTTRNQLAPVSELKWDPFSRFHKTHTVQRGETLYAIAFHYDIDFRHLAVLNHLRPPYHVRVGQVLNLHGTSRSVAAGKSVSRPRYHQSYVKPIIQAIYSPKVNRRSASGWMWPVGGRVVATFLPDQGKKGINIACKRGDKVYAAAGGIVAYAGSGLSGYGNLIIIKHNNEFLTAYGHNAKNLVSEGHQVKAGQIIAEAGLIDHKYWGVHFEIRKKGIPVNPLNYLQKG